MDDFQPLHPAIRGLKTVCRCNNIKYRTIERAIREGARSVADVAEKTGATTGHCGGSCTQETQEMLAELAPAPAKRRPAESRGSVTTSFPVENRSSMTASAETASVTAQAQGSGAANADAQPWWVRKK